MHVFAPNIVIGITILDFSSIAIELLLQDGQRKFCGFFFFFFFVRSRSNYFVHDGQHAHTLVVNIGPVPNYHCRELTVTNSRMLIRDFVDPLSRRQVDMLGRH